MHNSPALCGDAVRAGDADEQIQKFLGHSKLVATQVYAESSAEMMRESYQQAMGQETYMLGYLTEGYSQISIIDIFDVFFYF